MFEKIVSMFRGEKEPVELEVDSAPKKLEDLEAEELEAAEKRYREIREETEEVLEELQEELESLKGYEDRKSRSIVEDVVDNIASDRKRLINDFEMPEGPEELEEELDSLVDEFQTLSQKEAAVLEEVNLMDKIGQPLEHVKDKRDELEEFLQNGYQVEKALDRLEKLVEEKKRLEKDIKEAEEEIENLGIDEKQKDLDAAEKELEDLKNSEEWQGFMDEKEELEMLKVERREEEKKVESSALKMERGMKKLLYQVENGDLEFSGDKSILEDIKKGETGKLLERDTSEIVNAIEEATGILPTDLLDDSVHEKFMDGAEHLMSLERKNTELAELRNEISEKKAEIEENSLEKEKKRLEREMKQVKRKIDELEDRKHRLKERIEEDRKEISRKRQEIRDTLEEALDREVVFQQQTQSSSSSLASSMHS